MKAELGINSLMLMYVGNLEIYQGIDLLLESFALALKKNDSADLVVIGGQSSDIQKYQRKSKDLGAHRKVHFLGPKPLEHLAKYLSEADVLISPRVKGNNTPMKLYSYLHSGKPLLATDLPTHTQVLDSQVAMLAEPYPEAFSEAMLCLINDEALRLKLGMAGRKLVEEKYTYSVFRETLNQLLDWLAEEVSQEQVVVGRESGHSPKELH